MEWQVLFFCHLTQFSLNAVNVWLKLLWKGSRLFVARSKLRIFIFLTPFFAVQQHVVWLKTELKRMWMAGKNFIIHVESSRISSEISLTFFYISFLFRNLNRNLYKYTHAMMVQSVDSAARRFRFENFHILIYCVSYYILFCVARKTRAYKLSYLIKKRKSRKRRRCWWWKKNLLSHTHMCMHETHPWSIHWT